MINSNNAQRKNTLPPNLPLVSIIISGHDYGQYLSDAIESVLNQTYQNIEVIVVNDGSTDNTDEVLRKYNVERVFQEFQGLAAARNNGFKHSKGSFILFLDGDDKIAPEYIEKTMKVMLKDSRVGFVTTGSKIWYEENGFENVWMPRKILFRYELFAGWVAALGTVLMRREAFESLPEGFDSALPAHEDLDLCFRLLKNWKTDLVFEPLHWYRRHKVSLGSEVIETRRLAGLSLDRKYPYRKLYRHIRNVYTATVGRLVSFINHPVKYLEALREKAQLTVELHQCTFRNPVKVREYQKQILDIIDMKVEWSRNKDLVKYYEQRTLILKSMIYQLT
jgi:glycosyltransferase involved in cell wall biosynthesis